jgi:4-hydroxybenzoate polyprenyltransferase
MTVLSPYTRERLLTVPVIAAVLLVIVAAQLGRAEGTALLPLDAIRAFLLVVAFRIWDDLSDRPRDRERHPTRVTAQAESVTPLVIVAGLLGTIGILLTSLGLILLIYSIALAVWYRTRTSHSSLGTHLLLAKYPAFTFAMIGDDRAFTPRAVLVTAIVYLAACVYEWMHDARAPIGRMARAVEVTLLTCACVGFVVFFGGVR